MKFGKALIRCRELSYPDWSPYWLNYKQLKKIVKVISQEESCPTKQQRIARESLSTKLSSCPLEVEFFTQLREELKKVSHQYHKIEEGMCAQYRGLVESFCQHYGNLDPTNILRKLSESDALQLLDNIAKFYTDLLLLENFAVMNYCGFGKILKKHDKVTGFKTKSPFMQRVVDKQEFARHEKLLRMLQRTEQAYKRLLYVIPERMRHSLLGSSSGISCSVSNVTACTEQHRYSLGEETCNCPVHSQTTASLPETPSQQPHWLYPSQSVPNSFAWGGTQHEGSAFPSSTAIRSTTYPKETMTPVYQSSTSFPYPQSTQSVWLDDIDRQAAAAIASVRRQG